jgi:YHS domain-containing protein
MENNNANIDIMCGKELSERDPQYASEIEGKIHFFCSVGCKKQFDRGIAIVSERLAAANSEVR